MNCPECGNPNEKNSQFCSLCGTDLIAAKLDWRARILFFATPPFLLILCMALALDLGIAGAFEIGAEWGLILAFVFLTFGGGFWIVCRQMSISINHLDPWKAGIFAVIQIPIVLSLYFPLYIVLIENQNLSIVQSEKEILQLVLFLCLYVPLSVIGLYFIPHRNSELSTSKSKLIRLVEFLGPFKVSVLISIATLIIILLLPETQKEILFGSLKSEFGQNESALTHFERALTKSPNDPRLLLGKAKLLIKTPEPKKLLESIELLKLAAKNNTKNAEIPFWLSVAHEKLNMFDEAIAYASEAIRLKPNEPLFYIQLGDLYVTTHRREEAIPVYRKALSLNSNNPIVQNNLAYTLLELNRDLAEALELAKEAAEMRPNEVSILDTLAWAQFLNGNSAEAYNTIKKVRQVAEGNPVIEFHYAVIAHDLGLLTEPEKVFRKIWNQVNNTKDKLFIEQVEKVVELISNQSYQNASATKELRQLFITPNSIEKGEHDESNK